jgi:hypothetical protein
MLKSTLLGAAAFVTLLIGSAQAVTLKATPEISSSLSGFTVEFTDSNGNQLFDFSELDSFSGLTAGGTIVDVLAGIPDILSLYRADNRVSFQTAGTLSTRMRAVA